MKILVAIVSKGAESLGHTTLRWAPRAGFNLRIFIPNEARLSDYQQVIEQANYDWYLDLPYTVLVPGADPEGFAKAEGYDLLLTLSDHMKLWKKGDGYDGTVLHYATDVGKARVAFAKDSKLMRKRFNNGCEMVRL